MQDEQNIIAEDIEKEEEQTDDNLCKICRQVEIDQSESPNSVLCHTCREKMIKYPIPKLFILFLIIIVVLMGVAFWHFPKVLGCYKIYENSLEQAENGEISIAINDLNTVIKQYPDSIPIATRFTDIAMGGGYYDVASNVLSTYLMEKEMDLDTVDRLNQYINKLDRYYTSLESINEMQSKLDPALGQEDAIRASCNYTKGLLDDPKQDKAVLYYYLSMYTEDPNEVKSYLENCINEDKNFLDAKVQLATVLRSQGDLANAEMHYNQVLSEDKYYSGALRGLAIIKLLEGNKKDGLDLAYEAFDMDPEGTYVWETYIIALKENQKNSKLNAEIKAYLAKGNELEADTQDYLEGKTSLHDYYISE
ncbi:MAG: tetratricopeptide repeat protein [Aminipila sp.]